jgi:hypothetical protein
MPINIDINASQLVSGMISAGANTTVAVIVTKILLRRTRDAKKSKKAESNKDGEDEG